MHYCTHICDKESVLDTYNIAYYVHYKNSQNGKELERDKYEITFKIIYFVYLCYRKLIFLTNSIIVIKVIL